MLSRGSRIRGSSRTIVQGCRRYPQACQNHLLGCLAQTSRRHLSSRASTLANSSFKVSTVFGTLMAFGLGSTAYGIYQYYSTFTIWPEEVRGDLRAGIKAKNQGDLNLSERYLRRALETAQSLPLEKLSPEPYLKISGIASALAEVLESNNRPQAAYEVYVAILSHLQGATDKTGPEKLRTVAIAYKLGEMAETYQQPAEEEEKWLTFAVEEVLRILRDFQSTYPEKDFQAQVNLSELELPSGFTEIDIAAPMKSLAAEMMNSIANVLIQISPTPERREQAEVWVKKALALLLRTKSAADAGEEPRGEIDKLLTSTLYNLGSFREMDNDLVEARKYYVESRGKASEIKMREGIMEADLAIRRIDRLTRPQQGPP